MGIRAKITIPFLILFIIVFLVVSATSVILVAKATEKRIINQLQDLAGFISQSRWVPLNRKSLEYIRQATNAHVAIVHDQQILLDLTTFNEPYKSELVTFLKKKGLSNPVEVEFSNGIRFVGISSYIKEECRIFLFFPANFIEKEKVRAIKPLLIVFVIGLILVVIFGLFTAKGIAKPIEQLSNWAKKIASEGPDAPMFIKRPASEVNELAKTLNWMLEELKKMQKKIVDAEKARVLKELSVSVAHEIKNPLQALKLIVQMQDLKDKKILLNEIDRIELASLELLSIAGPLRLKLEQIKPSKIVDDVLELLRRKLQHLQIKVTKIYKDVPNINVDVNRIKRVIMNLILNGAQAMPRGGDLKIKIESTDGMVRLSFKDHGKGIPDEIKERIFEPFVTTKMDGIGLGLFVTKKIIQEHGGKIGFESNNQGTTFWVEIPHAKGNNNR